MHTCGVNKGKVNREANVHYYQTVRANAMLSSVRNSKIPQGDTLDMINTSLVYTQNTRPQKNCTIGKDRYSGNMDVINNKTSNE